MSEVECLTEMIFTQNITYSISVHSRGLCNYRIQQQMHVYKHVPPHVIILNQQVSVILVTFITVFYNRNTIIIQKVNVR
jgi:hypothetical protein